MQKRKTKKRRTRKNNSDVESTKPNAQTQPQSRLMESCAAATMGKGKCKRERGAHKNAAHLLSLPYIHTYVPTYVHTLARSHAAVGLFAFLKFTFVCMCSPRMRAAAARRANSEQTEKKMTSRLSIAERRVDVAPFASHACKML